MKKVIIVVICVLNFIPLIASAQGKTKERKDKETLNYSIEYLPPILEADTAHTLLVKFYTKVTTQQAETVVRSELDRILKNSPPKSDIIASAWYLPTNKPNDESPILLPDGSSGLIYSYKRGNILTTKEYSSAELPSPNVSKLIIVKFNDVQFQVNQDGRAVVLGTTNLPNGASIMIWIRNKNYGGAQSTVTVNQGKFISELFSDRGNKLPSGEYEVDISLSAARFQSPEVQNIIGQKGENLSGEFVRLTDLGAGNVVDFSKNLIIP